MPKLVEGNNMNHEEMEEDVIRKVKELHNKEGHINPIGIFVDKKGGVQTVPLNLNADNGAGSFTAFRTTIEVLKPYLEMVAMAFEALRTEEKSERVRRKIIRRWQTGKFDSLKNLPYTDLIFINFESRQEIHPRMFKAEKGDLMEEEPPKDSLSIGKLPSMLGLYEEGKTDGLYG
jgi:hypothetical protein